VQRTKKKWGIFRLSIVDFPLFFLKVDSTFEGFPKHLLNLPDFFVSQLFELTLATVTGKSASIAV